MIVVVYEHGSSSLYLLYVSSEWLGGGPTRMKAWERVCELRDLNFGVLLFPTYVLWEKLHGYIQIE